MIAFRDMKRRKFLKVAAGLVGVPTLGIGYGLLEACAIHVTRDTVAVPKLPKAFAGKTVALLVQRQDAQIFVPLRLP